MKLGIKTSASSFYAMMHADDKNKTDKDNNKTQLYAWTCNSDMTPRITIGPIYKNIGYFMHKREQEQ